MTNKAHLQFFVKCQHIDTGKVMTYRFAHQNDLLAFSQTLYRNKLAIVDTHIAFYDIELLFNPFDCDNPTLSPTDINIAIDGKLID